MPTIALWCYPQSRGQAEPEPVPPAVRQLEESIKRQTLASGVGVGAHSIRKRERVGCVAIVERLLHHDRVVITGTVRL
jgi:hypothetical protein